VNPLIKCVHRASWPYARADGWCAGPPQGLSERVADVADYRLPGRDRKSMPPAPVFPRGFQALRGALSTCGRIWITHRATSPESGPAPASCLAVCARRTKSLPDSTPAVTLRHRGRPPISIDRVLPRSPVAGPGPPGEDGRRSLGTLLRNTRKQCTNRSRPVAPVSPQRADRGQFAGLSPPCDGLGVDAKHRGDLRGCQQWLGLWCTCGHVCGLSSWTSVAILCLLCCWCSVGSLSGMSYMADRDHIAITRGDASTTRCKVSVPGCPVPPIIASLRVSIIILIVAGGQIRKYPARFGNTVRPSSPTAPGTQFARSNSANARHRLCARMYMATASSRSPLATPSMAARISATDWSPQSASSLARCTNPP